MEMRVRPGASAREVRLGDGELLERSLEHDPATEERLPFTGSTNYRSFTREDL
jgi:hypothetical protein